MRIPTKIYLILLLTAFISNGVSQTPDDDQVDMAIPNYNHKIYSGKYRSTIGFLIINTFKSTAIHYVYFPSQNDQASDPLVIWLSGGPGCSSLLATFYENGPLIFYPQQKNFRINEHSWNKKANLLYLQLPGAVGYSQGPENQTITDASFAKDAISSLSLFLARFPALRKNDIYLTGHGYAGVYIAYTAKLIIQTNNDPQAIFSDKFKLKGILIGNPCVRPDECEASGAQKQSYYHYQFLYNRGFYTKKTWNEFRGICTLNYSSFECYTKRIEMDKQFAGTNTSSYNIYDKCYKSTSNQSNYVNTGCEDNIGILTFLNDPSIKTKWNIISTKEWQPCNKKIFQQYRGSRNAYELMPFLIQSKLRIWVYSGDLDSYIPIIGTKRWLQDLRHSLDMPVRRIWREWWIPGKHSGEDQVGGFIWELRDLTFASVKGAGFRTCFDQPQAMSQVLQGFLDGQTLPYKSS